MPRESLLKKIAASPEGELLVHCARLEIEEDRAERIRALAASDLDWTRLLALAQRQALIPLLFFHLNRIAATQVPADQLKRLRDRAQANAALNVVLTGEMVRLLDLFENKQIPAIPYKGPAIGVGIYGNLALRQFADLDILVPEADVWKATELLIEQGYQAHFVIPAKKQSKFIRLSYVRLFQHETRAITVELHWRLAPRFFGAPFDTSTLWKRSRQLELQGSSVRMPSPEDLLLMLSIHGAKDCWEKLEWVCGLAELLRSATDIDWKRLLTHAKEIRCMKILALGLLLAHELLGAPVPNDVLEKISARKQLNALVSQISTRLVTHDVVSLSLSQRIRFHLSLKDSLVDKVKYCSRLMLTTTPVDWEIVSLPNSASFAYLPLRAFRLIRKYGGDDGPPVGTNAPIKSSYPAISKNDILT
jgi:hypothetical protein